MKTEVTAKITINKESRSFPLTIDWEGLKEDEMRALAQRSIVIAWQNKHRVADEGKGQWPSDNPSIKAVDWKLGSRVQVQKDPVKMIEAGELSAEQLAALAEIIRKKMANKG